MTAVSRFEWERQLRDDEDVLGNRLLVLLTLATYMDHDGGRARPAVATLAAKTGLHPGTISRHLKAARADGWLELVSRGHRRGDGVAVTSTYRATVPEALPRNESEVERAVEDDLYRAADGLYRAPAPPLPRNESATIIPDHGLTTFMCVADLACSKLSTDTPKQHDEARVKIAALVAIHGEDAVRLELAAMPDACIPFGGELVRILKDRLGEPQRQAACPRCNDTGQTSTGYVCGCPGTTKRRVS